MNIRGYRAFGLLSFLFLQMLPIHFYAMEFQSLWLDSQRTSWPQLQSDLHCDVAVVGAGISGVATLYYLLTSTEKRVALFERDFVASGATGHNAGLPTVYIERPIAELVEEFGFEPVKQAYNEINSGMQLLYDISEKIGFESELFPIPVIYFGFPSISTLLQFLEANDLSLQIGHHNWTYWVIDDEEIKQQIPSQFHSLVQWVSREQILNALEISDTNCIGLAKESSGRIRMNSALFCDQLLQYLSKTFPARCLIYERSEISQIDLQDEEQILHHAFGKIFTNDAILCTNAYRNFVIIDERTKKSVTKLKEMVFQREGFLAAYPSKASHSSLTGFMSEEEFPPAVSYWYLSTTPISQSKDNKSVCLIGGPEYTLSSPLSSEEITQKAEESLQLMKKFLSQRLESPSSFSFFWHGTMGYTHNGLRWVGEDPDHPHLWYNLGCNGIGILPAIAGAQKIAKKMSGEIVGRSIFDPPASAN